MDLAVFSEIYIYCKYLNPGQSLSVCMGQHGEMGQPKKGTIGIFHGFARAGQNGTVRVTVRTAGAEGSDFSRNLTIKFLAPCYIVLRPFRSFSWSGIRSYSIV